MGSLNESFEKVETKRKHSKNLFGFGDIYKPAWFRCSICVYNKTDRKLRDYRRYILWGSAILFWALFFAFP